MDKWNYTFQSYQKLQKDPTKAGELVYDAVYFNPFYNFKQWYTPYEIKNERETIYRLDAVVLTQVKVK